MSVDSWYNQYIKCLRSRGTLLSFYENPINVKVAKTLMNAYSISAIFMGMQKHQSDDVWSPDWYQSLETNFSVKEDLISSFINSNVLVAELSDDNFVLSSMYGHAESPKAAICEFSKKHVHIFLKHSTDFIMVFQLALSSSTIGASHLIPLNL